MLPIKVPPVLVAPKKDTSPRDRVNEAAKKLEAAIKYAQRRLTRDFRQIDGIESVQAQEILSDYYIVLNVRKGFPLHHPAIEREVKAMLRQLGYGTVPYFIKGWARVQPWPNAPHLPN